VLDEDGTKDFAIEHILARLVDGPAAPAFDSMRADRFPLTEGGRFEVARFMSAQLTRGPRIRENLSEFMLENMRRAVALAAQHYTDEQWREAIGEVPSPEVRRRMLNSDDHFDIRPTNAGLLEVLFGTVEEIAGLLMPRSWTLVRFRTPSLFTSAHPVIFIYMNPALPAYGVAIADQIYLPVSTTHGLASRPPGRAGPTRSSTGARSWRADSTGRCFRSRLARNCFYIPTSSRIRCPARPCSRGESAGPGLRTSVMAPRCLSTGDVGHPPGAPRSDALRLIKLM
jgi:hypothetical protein